MTPLQTHFILDKAVSSIEDVAHNTLGALIGALLALMFTPRGRSGQWFVGLWRYFFAPGSIVNVALLSLSFWLAAELFPYALSFDISTIKAALHPLVYELRNPTDFDVWKMLVEAEGLTVAGMLLRVSMGKTFFLAWSTLLVGVSLLKVIVVWQVISPEYLVGAFVAWLLLALPGESGRRAQAFGGLLAAIAYLVLQSLRQEAPAQPHVFNWIPFAEQIDALPRIVGLLETLWIALAMVVFTRLLTDNSQMMRWLRWLGGFLLFCGWFWLEWHKQILPGRYGDITDPLVGLAVWMVGWSVLRSFQPAVENQDLTTGSNSFSPTQKQG